MPDIPDIAAFFRELGELHDCRIRLSEPVDHTTEWRWIIDDLLSNFRENDDERLLPAELTFRGLPSIPALREIPKDSGIYWVYECTAVGTPEATRVTVKFVPHGIIEFECSQVAISAEHLPAIAEFSPLALAVIRTA